MKFRICLEFSFSTLLEVKRVKEITQLDVIHTKKVVKIIITWYITVQCT